MRRILFLFVACLLLFAIFLPFQGTAHAASVRQTIPGVSCSGNGCNNTDPYVTGCASSQITVASTEAVDANYDMIGTISLQYSNTCKTNWTDVSAVVPQGHTIYIIGQIDRASGPDGGALSYIFSSSRYSWINTNQVYSPHNLDRSCGAVGNGLVSCVGYL